MSTPGRLPKKSGRNRRADLGVEAHSSGLWWIRGSKEQLSRRVSTAEIGKPVRNEMVLAHRFPGSANHRTV